MRLVHPYVDREPNMVLVEAVRGGKPRMTVEKPLIIFQEQGKYTQEICQQYGF
jgi:tRNA1Val (adenine37-N6)-methyltransferase